MKKTKKITPDQSTDVDNTHSVDALFAFIKDTEVPTPTRAEFKAMLSRISTSPVVSPYTPLLRAFTTLRFVTPLALGLLIVVSGIGIETGRLPLESTPTVSHTMIDTTVFSTQISTTTEKALSKESPIAVSLEEEVIAQEENYDTYFASENEAFTGLTEVYEVTI